MFKKANAPIVDRGAGGESMVVLLGGKDSIHSADREQKQYRKCPPSFSLRRNGRC
jgi:hypothetical protein